MDEPIPRSNCPTCGATVCFDLLCSLDIVAQGRAFIACAPEEFFSGAIPQATKSRAYDLGGWVRADRAKRQHASYVIMAAMRLSPRVKFAFQQGEFTGWPELDAASRLGGYEAALDVAFGIIARLP